LEWKTVRLCGVVLPEAPLPAEFGLVRGATRNRFRVVADQRQLADLQALGQAAQQPKPLFDHGA